MPVVWKTNCNTYSVLVLFISLNINHTLRITDCNTQKPRILPTHCTVFVCFIWFSCNKQRLLQTIINDFFYVHASCFPSCRKCSVKNIIYISVMFLCGSVLWYNVTYKLFIRAAINRRVGVPADCHLQSFLSSLPAKQEPLNRFIAYKIWYWDCNINVSDHSSLG